MLKVIILSFFILTSCATKPKVVKTPIIKGTIAVLNFKNNSPNKNWNYIESAVAEIFTSNLAGNSDFRVVEREKLNKILEEQKLNQSGIVDEVAAVKIGKILGATEIVLGSITQLGKTIVISARLIKVETGEIYAGETVNGEKEEELPEMVKKLSDKIVTSLSK
ncbi:MAG: CsgG/HfaB family protein [Elusimicrobiota bacterium]|nr:CsgG/HfaB family protein [Elusimicrobiota bacterium]